eukprot:sb/3469629/
MKALVAMQQQTQTPQQQGTGSEDKISKLRDRQLRRGVRDGEPDVRDESVAEQYKKLMKPPPAPRRKNSQDVFNERRASLQQFLASPEKRTRPEMFTYLNLGKKVEPWFKNHGQQDTGLGIDDIIEGQRVSDAPKKDDRFPDYHKKPQIHRASSMASLNASSSRRESSSRGPNDRGRRRSSKDQPRAGQLTKSSRSASLSSLNAGTYDSHNPIGTFDSHRQHRNRH